MIVGFILVELEGNRLQIWSSCSRRNRALIMGPWRLVHTSSCLNEKRAMKCYHNEPMENAQEIALFETFWKYAAYDYCRTVYRTSVICMRNAYAHPQLPAQHLHLNDLESASMTADSVHIFNHLISLAFSLKIRSKKKEASLPAIVWTIRRRSTCKEVCSPQIPFFQMQNTMQGATNTYNNIYCYI